MFVIYIKPEYIIQYKPIIIDGVVFRFFNIFKCKSTLNVCCVTNGTEILFSCFRVIILRRTHNSCSHIILYVQPPPPLFDPRYATECKCHFWSRNYEKDISGQENDWTGRLDGILCIGKDIGKKMKCNVYDAFFKSGLACGAEKLEAVRVRMGIPEHF